MERPNPFREALRIDIESPADGECRTAVSPHPAACEPPGKIAQGVVLTMLDLTLGHAIGSRFTEEVPFVTAALLIVFHGRLPGVGVRCRATSPELPEDWNEVVASGRVEDTEGRLVATAQGLFARRPGGPGGRPEVQSPSPAAYGSFEELVALREERGGLVFPVAPQHLNVDNVLHGGASASAMDLAMRRELRARGAGELQLRTFHVRYMLPGVPPALSVEVDVQRFGRAIHFVRAQLHSPQGLVAAADATYAPPPS